jgi:hypothetical protein
MIHSTYDPAAPNSQSDNEQNPVKQLEPCCRLVVVPGADGRRISQRAAVHVDAEAAIA